MSRRSICGTKLGPYQIEAPLGSGGLKRLFEQNDRSGLRADLIDKIERILTLLDAASIPQALDLPGYRLH